MIFFASTGTPLSHNGTPRSGLNATPLNSTPQLSFGATPNSGFRDQDLMGEASCQEGTTWVTVFGFPPSAASYILSQFSQCGTILQHYIPPNGNWMNIRFQVLAYSRKFRETQDFALSVVSFRGIFIGINNFRLKCKRKKLLDEPEGFLVEP